MKYLNVILLFGMVTFLAGGWETLGPDGGYVRSIVVSPGNDNILYLASYYSPSRIYRSTDAGANWTEMGYYLSYNYCLAVDPSDILYAGCYGHVYKSTDFGVSWTDATVSYTYVYDLVVHPTDPSIIYGAGRHYLSSGNYALAFIKSTDSGMSWTINDLISGGYCYGYSIAVDPLNPDVVYCGGCSYGSSYEPKIFKSTNGGSTFTQVYSSSSGYYVYGLAVHPTNSDIVYACTYYDGIYRSTNAGNSWSKATSYNYNYRIKTTPANPDYVYCSGYRYFRKSTNAGVSWTAPEDGLCGYYNYGLAVNHSDETEVFLSNRAGVFKTVDGANTWFGSSKGIKLGLPAVVATAAPSNPQSVYCQVEDIGVYKTTNCGADWSLCPSFSSCGDMIAIAVKNDDPDYVMAIEGFG